MYIQNKSLKEKSKHSRERKKNYEHSPFSINFFNIFFISSKKKLKEKKKAVQTKFK